MHNFKNLEFLLRELNITRKKYEERVKNEDNFNLFTILKKESDEVYLHSRFLSSLLDPSGPHKMGTYFLDSFLEIIKSEFKYNKNTLEVYPNNYDRCEYKEIDICFIDRYLQKAVILENKIFHTDSNHKDIGQLENYYNKLITEDYIPEDGIEVYYLTLEGHEPSENSTNKSGQYPQLKDKVRCISYSLEILEWLDNSVKASYNKPLLRESINQYIKLIEEMTNNDTTEEEHKEIIEIIGKNEDNLLSTKLLLDNFNHVKWYTLKYFWSELISKLTINGYIIKQTINDTDLDTLVFGGQRQRKIDLEIDFIKNGLMIFITANYDDWLYWGIYEKSITNYKITPALKSKIKLFIKNNSQFIQDGDGARYKYFDFTDDENICCSDFDCDGTFNLISPRHREQIIQKIVDEINKYFYKIENI